MSRSRVILAALALALAAAAIRVSPASAQADSTSAVPKSPEVVTTPAAPQGYEFLSGAYFAGSFPMGDWGDIAGFGLAIDGADVVRKPEKPFGLRSSLGLLYNFSRTVDVPGSQLAANDKLSIETKNWSLFFGVGPEFSAPNKTVTPFIFGTVGFDTYWTSSTLAGTAGGSSYSAEHGDSRIAFAWAAGLGFRRTLAPGYLMELSAEYRSGTDHQYLRPQDVTSTSGTVVADRQGHQSDQILIRLGTVLGGAGH